MTLYFVEPNYHLRSQRDKELVASGIRSHATKLSHARRNKCRKWSRYPLLGRRQAATWPSLQCTADGRLSFTTSSAGLWKHEETAVPGPSDFYEIRLGSSAWASFGMRGMEYIGEQALPHQSRLQHLFQYYVNEYAKTSICHPTNLGAGSQVETISSHIQCCLRSPIAMEAYLMCSQLKIEVMNGKELSQGPSIIYMEHRQRLWALMRDSVQKGRFDDSLFFGFFTSMSEAVELGDWQVLPIQYQGVQQVLKIVGNFSSFPTQNWLESTHTIVKLCMDSWGLSSEGQDVPPIISAPTSLDYLSSGDLPAGVQEIYHGGHISTRIMQYLLQVQAWSAEYKKQNYSTRHFLGKVNIAIRSAYYLKDSDKLTVYEKLILTAVVACLRSFDGGFAIFLEAVAHICMDPYFDNLPTMSTQLQGSPTAECLMIWVGVVVAASKKNATDPPNYSNPEWKVLVQLASREPWSILTWQGMRLEMQKYFYDTALDDDWGHIWTIARALAQMEVDSHFQEMVSGLCMNHSSQK